MKPSRELTAEEIPQALAEAQGWTVGIYPNKNEYYVDITTGINIYRVSEYDPLNNAEQQCNLTEDPEIHAGMCDVLDEWFYEYNDTRDWWTRDKYLQAIPLWQLRAVVEYLRRRGK